MAPRRSSARLARPALRCTTATSTARRCGTSTACRNWWGGRRRGSRVSTEAYPYGSGMTGIGAAFLAPERLHERDLRPGAYVRADGRASPARNGCVSSRGRSRRPCDHQAPERGRPRRHGCAAAITDVRRRHRGERCDAADLDGPRSRSDELATARVGRHPPAHGRDLLADGADAGSAVGTGGPLGLTETLRRSSLLPARLLEARVPAMRRKGRSGRLRCRHCGVRPGDGSDQATYTHTTRWSAGIRYVLVNGDFVVSDARLVTSALPGGPVRAGL